MLVNFLSSLFKEWEEVKLSYFMYTILNIKYVTVNLTNF